MSEEPDPEAYDITVGEIGMMPDDDYDPEAGVEITDERYASLRDHLFEAYDGSTASRFAVRDLARLDPDRYVVSFHRHGGGRGSWQSEYVAIRPGTPSERSGSFPQSSESPTTAGTESGLPPMDPYRGAYQTAPPVRTPSRGNPAGIGV